MTKSQLSHPVNINGTDDRLYFLAQDPSASPAAPMRGYVEIIYAGRGVNFGLSCNYDNSIPSTVYHGREAQIGVDPRTDGAKLTRWLQSIDAQELLYRICDGYTENWDGSNYRGYLSADAQAAKDRLERLIQIDNNPAIELDGDNVGAQIAADWLDIINHADTDGCVYVDDYKITAHTPDDDLAQWSESINDMARAENIVLYNTLDTLEDLRSMCQDDDN